MLELELELEVRFEFVRTVYAVPKSIILYTRHKWNGEMALVDWAECFLLEKHQMGSVLRHETQTERKSFSPIASSNSQTLTLAFAFVQCLCNNNYPMLSNKCKCVLEAKTRRRFLDHPSRATSLLYVLSLCPRYPTILRPQLQLE